MRSLYRLSYFGGTCVSFEDSELFVFFKLFIVLYDISLVYFFLKRKIIRTLNSGYVKYGFQKVRNTINHNNNSKKLKNFYFHISLYIDAINTIIFFARIYANSSLNFSWLELYSIFLIVQFTAIWVRFLFGYLMIK